MFMGAPRRRGHADYSRLRDHLLAHAWRPALLIGMAPPGHRIGQYGVCPHSRQHPHKGADASADVHEI